MKLKLIKTRRREKHNLGNNLISFWTTPQRQLHTHLHSLLIGAFMSRSKSISRERRLIFIKMRRRCWIGLIRGMKEDAPSSYIATTLPLFRNNRIDRSCKCWQLFLVKRFRLKQMKP